MSCELRVFLGVFLAARFSSLASPSSDGIHKRLFGAVEDDDAQEQGECREGRCVGQSGQRRVAGSEEAVFKTFNDVGDRIPPQNVSSLFAERAHRINNGSGVHCQLHTERKQKRQVAIFCC